MGQSATKPPDPHRAGFLYSPIEPDRAAQVAILLRSRLRRFAEVRRVAARWPGGFVPVGVAAWILNVRQCRIRELLDAGRLPEELVGGVRMIPVDALIDAPTPLEQGRPTKPRESGKYQGRDGPHVNGFLGYTEKKSFTP